MSRRVSDNARWVRPLGTAAGDGWDVAIDDRGRRAGRTRGLYAVDARCRARAAPSRAGEWEHVVVPLAGSVSVTAVDREGESTMPLAGPGVGLRRARPTSPTPPRDCDVTVTAEGGPPGRGLRRPRGGAAHAAVPPRGRRGRARRAARRRAVASREVRNFGVPGVLDADSIIACEVSRPAGNWSSYPPHKHDEERPGVETELEEIYYFEVAADGGCSTEAPEAVGYQRVYGTDERPIDVLAEVRIGRRRARAARLARAGDGRPRLRPLLPQRHGRPRRGAGLAHLRRPGPRLGARHLGRPARRPPTSPWRCSMTSDDPALTATVRLTVAQAVVRFLANQWSERDGERQKLFAGCFGIFGHGNVAGIGQALLQNELADGEERLPYVLARNEQAMVHTVRRLRPPEGPPPDVGVHRVRRPRLDEHADRRGARHDQPDPGAAAAVRHLRDPASAPRCSRSSSCRMPPT